MDITQFIERYKKPAFIELLNIIHIKNWRMGSADWRMYCLRHHLITRATKTVRVIRADKQNNHFYYRDTPEGRKYQRWDEPQVLYRLCLKNGSGKTILELRFTQEMLEEWKQNETNPNQTEPTSLQ